MNKIKYISVLVCGVLVFCGTAKAQAILNLNNSEPAKCFEVGLSAGLDQYRGDYHGFVHALKDFDYKIAFGLNARYNFNNSYSPSVLHRVFDRRLSFQLDVKKLSASANKKDYGDRMTMDIWEIGLMAQYNILKYSSVRAANADAYPITPYVEAGFAISGFKCDNTNPSVSTPVAGEYADDSYKFYPVAMIGWGLKINLCKGVTLGLDGSYRFTFTDGIDHNTAATQRNDQYYFVGADIMFNIGELFKK